MKAIKKITAVAVVLAMVLSLSACIHKKGEIAVTVGDVEFTSAYYMTALINAQNEAQQKVSESEDLSEDEQNGSGEIDYYSKKIDKKSFTDWVEDRAIEILKEIAAYKTLCKENKIELTDEQKDEAKQAAEYYWTSYGYSNYFEPNGVSKETYMQYMIDGYYAEEYFQYVYGEEGTKALKAEDVKKETTDNYILVDVIQSSYNEGATDDQKKAAKAALEADAKDIKTGKKTFEEVYNEHNGNEEHSHDGDGDELTPVNPHATIMGAEDTSYASEYYDTFKGYKVNEPKVIESTDETGVLLVIKRNLSKDEYYMDRLDSYARHALADEDFDKEIDDYTKGLKTDINKYALSQFSVKKIKIPEATA